MKLKDYEIKAIESKEVKTNYGISHKRVFVWFKHKDNNYWDRFTLDCQRNDDDSYWYALQAKFSHYLVGNSFGDKGSMEVFNILSKAIIKFNNNLYDKFKLSHKCELENLRVFLGDSLLRESISNSLDELEQQIKNSK